MATPLKLAATVTLDASQVPAGAQATKQAIAGIGTEATTASTKLQQLIAAQTGLSSSAGVANQNMREWAGALAMQGRSLDELRAKYNPLFGTINQYKSALTEIRTLHAQGVLSTNEMTAAISRQRQAALGAIDALKGRNAASRNSGSGNALAASNLTYQAQDVITQAAMGGVPAWMIGLQQGPQAAMSFQGQSTKQALSTLAGGISGLLTPMSLITVGLTTATAAAVQFGVSLLGSLNSTASALDKHEAAMQRIKSLYDGAASSGEQFGQRTQAAITFEGNQDRRNLEKALETSLKTTAYRTTPAIDMSQYSYPGADVAGIQAQALQDTYGQLAGTVAQFSDAARVGKGDVLEFNAQIREIANTDPSNKFLQDAASQLLKYTENATAAANALKELNDRQREMTMMMARSNAAQAAQQYQGDNERQRYFGTRQYDAEVSGIGARSPTEIAAAERRRLEAQPVDVKEDPQTRSLRINQSVDLAYQRANQSLVESQRDRQLSIDQTIEAQRRELALIGSKTAATEAEKFAAEQIAAVKLAAARQGVAADENEIRLIREKAEEYGKLKQQIAAITYLRDQKVGNDRLGFQIGIAGKSQTEQAGLLAQYDAELKIRELGLEASSAQANQIRRGASAQAQMNAELSRTSEAWSSIRKSSESAIDGIVDGLSSGDISGALEGISKDIQKTVLDLAVKNPLKNALTGSNYGTLADVGGVKGVASNLLGDSKSVGSMAVTAGTVMINGGVAGTGVAAAGLQAANTNTTGTSSANALTGLGQSMSSAGNYKGGGVDPRLTDILNTAAQRTPGYKVDAISGFRAGDPRFHGKGLATDVQLTDLASGKKLGNYQDASSFGSYEKFAQTARSVQMEKYPELANQFRWGGYFGGGKGKYGALDTMHFDLGGDKAGMGGGSWDKGLTSAQSSLWPGIQSSSTKAADALNQFSTGTAAANQNLGVFGNGLSQLGNGLTGLLSGGGSGLSSILSGLTSSSFKTNTTLGSFLTNGFDGGGFTGAGGRKEPAGVVHKGEVVWSQDDVARAGGAATVDAMRLGYRGYDKGGVVGGSAAASKSSNDNGGGNITIHNYSKANVQTEQTTDASGRRQTKFVIADMTGDAIGTKGGKASKTIEQQYGIKKKGIAR
ncbi:hypothetical protein GOZ90_11645 [Agrobacterium vitis]|uniref:Bacteriophage tail tape measure N-terminal domain-containing protein n=1 Tax=Agrobacterium vitis TaxID=373 RepID=A0A6L6VEI3_AGRVI|nr:hypothetical protein [Agrobacterium vitis]MUZ73335.1 hypothetical protein [Agrobacterium vitis]